jgi:hypothetical protein
MLWGGRPVPVHEVHGGRFVGLRLAPAKCRGTNPRGPPPCARPLDSTVNDVPLFGGGEGEGFCFAGPTAIGRCLWLCAGYRPASAAQVTSEVHV